MTYNDNIKSIDALLKPDECFDITKRKILLSGTTEAVVYYVDGLTATDLLEKIFEFLSKDVKPSELPEKIPFIDAFSTKYVPEVVGKILEGYTALCSEGHDGILLMQARRYPARGIEEPENDKLLRGPRVGFSETVIENTALIRRRIRHPALKFISMKVGSITKSDVVVCYLKGSADEELVKEVKRRINDIRLDSINFSEQTISEAIVKSSWWNPFPKVRYTERPDTAAAMIEEGSVLILCDNSPSAIILPVSIFDFLQEAEDFYMPPITSTYLRMVRLFIMVLSVFLLPCWYLAILHPEHIPDAFSFLLVSEKYSLPIYWQIIMIEIIVDGLKIASLNTPSTLGSSLSVISGLILGDLAVNIGWFVPEVILYLAFVSIATFTQPSYEMGYALKLMRIIILTGAALFDVVGFAGGIAVVVVLLLSNKTVKNKRGYLYPLIPWNARAMKRFFVRVRLKPGER